MEQTGFTTTATSAFIVSATDYTGRVYTMTKSWGQTVPTNAIIRNVWIIFYNTYQYSTTRLAVVKGVDLFVENMCAPFSTNGSSASSNVDEGFQKDMYSDKKFYQAITQFRIRVCGGGGSAGNVFQILNGCQIDIFMDWERGIQPWHKTGGVWNKTTFWNRFNGVWYETMTRQKTSGYWW